MRCFTLFVLTQAVLLRYFLALYMPSLKEKALAEHFGQPVVGYFYPSSIISHDRGTHAVDFSTVSTGELINFTVPLRLERSIVTPFRTGERLSFAMSMAP